jgi:hypothetical protein
MSPERNYPVAVVNNASLINKMMGAPKWNEITKTPEQNQVNPDLLQFNNVMNKSVHNNPDAMVQSNIDLSMQYKQQMMESEGQMETRNNALQSMQPFQPPIQQSAPMQPTTVPPQAFQPMVPEYNPQPPVQVVRRNFTVAEIIGVVLVSTMLLGGIQSVWNVVPKPIINIEWRR